METPSPSDGHENVGRRVFLRMAGGAGLAGMLAACGSSAPEASGSGGTTSAAPVGVDTATAGTSGAGLTSAATGTAEVTSGAAPAFDGKLQFVGWDFQPDTIKKLIGEWSKTSNIPVDVQIIPNVGYTAAIQTRLRGGAKYDAYYNFAYSSQKFVKSKWAAKLDGLPGVDTMMDEMFPSARSRYLDLDGSVISTPYFSAVHMLNYNKSFVEKAGFSGPPQSLSETYDQCKKMKTSGVCDTPYVAYWIKDFCEEYFNVYLLAEGVQPFDDKGDPVFADDPKSETVFEWWQTMYNENLTPKSILTDDTSTISTYIAKGTGAFLVLHHYFLSSIRQSKGPEANNTAQISAGGASGKTLQIGEVLQMGEIDDDAQRAATWELMKYYGWKDDKGKFSVFAAWAKAAGLAAPYAGFFTDPEVKAAFPDYYDLPMLSNVFEKGSDVVPSRTLPWYPDFQSKVGDLVQTMLLGKATPKETVSALADAAKSAKSGGGL